MKRILSRICIILLLLLIVYALLYFNGRLRFETSFYQISSEKTEERIRLICLSDLHGWTFGKDNERLVSRIENLRPDLILIAGDMVTFGQSDFSSAVSLCSRLAEFAPVYYSFGNHENRIVYGENLSPEFLGQYDEILLEEGIGMADFEKIPAKDPKLLDALEDSGVALLNNQTASVQVKGCQVDLAGLNMESGAYYRYAGERVRNFLAEDADHFKVIIAHKPAVCHALEAQEGLRYDLLFCGHLHGGIIRLPGLGGLLRPDGEPPWKGGWDSGLSEREQGTVFLGRGLGNSNPLPRIGNPPELAVIDVY